MIVRKNMALQREIFKVFIKIFKVKKYEYGKIWNLQYF